MIRTLRKIGITVAIAVLFAILVFAVSNMIHPKPAYDDFCEKGLARPVIINKSLDVVPEKEDCYVEYENARGINDLVFFLVSGIFGLAAIIFGLAWKGKGEFWILIKAGFLIGGLASLFIGTGVYYEELGRFLKPIVISLELAIIIFVAHKLTKRR